MNRVQKLCALPIATLLLQSCGKKINSEASDGAGVFRPGITNLDINLESTIDRNTSRFSDEEVNPRLGLSKIPDSINVTEGNAGNFYSKLFFNVETNGDYEFYCLYRGGSALPNPSQSSQLIEFEKGLKYSFVSCFDQDNRDIGIELEDLENYTTPIDDNKKVKLVLVGGHPDLRTKANVNLRVEIK
jgi:hypothetical protein